MTDLHPPRLSAGSVTKLQALIAALDRLDAVLRLPADGDAADPVLLGRFRLRRRLGEGRFGVAVLADDPPLGRPVVVKVPQPAALADPAWADRLGWEAQAVARLDHPGVVPVFEAGEDGGLPYLVTAFVDGPTLAGWMAAHDGPVPCRLAARLVAAVAAAVHHAHHRGVLHCDLKPANVLLDPAAGPDHLPGLGVPRVADFGLARLLDGGPAGDRTVVAGTPAYMAPEQARGDRRAFSARTDVYALGAVLYALLTGRPPFDRPDAGLADRAAAVADPPVPPGRLRPDVPADLAAVCLRALADDPDGRYPSADALADDLHRFLAGRPVAARPVHPLVRAGRLVHRHPATTAALSLAGLVAAGAVAVAADRWAREVRSRADGQVAEAERAAADARAGAAEFHAALARARARRLARPAGWAAASRSELRAVAGRAANGDDRAAVRTELAAAAAAVDLGEPRAVAVGFRGYDVAFGPGGAVLAVGGWAAGADGAGEVRLYDPATGAETRRLRFPLDPTWEARAEGRPDGCRAVAFSPDGRRLAVGTRSGWVAVWDLAHERDDPAARWRHAPPPAGGVEAARAEHVERLAFDAEGRLWSGDRATVAAWKRRPTGPWAEDGRLKGHLVRPAGGTLIWGTATDTPAAVSDASALVRVVEATQGLTVGAVGDADPAERLALPDTDRAEDVRVTDLAVSPDGRAVATAAEHAGHLKLWDLVSGRLLAARTLPGGSLRLAFRPDGGAVAVAVGDGVLLFDVARPAAETLLGGQVFPIDDADLTPDGRRLATAAAVPNRAGAVVAVVQMCVFAADNPTAGLPQFSDQPSRPWSNRRRVAVAPDGRRLATQVLKKGIQLSLPAGEQSGWACPSEVREVRYAPGGALWAAGGPDVSVWPGRVEQLPAGGGATALSADDQGADVGRSDGGVTRYAADGRELGTTGVGGPAVTTLARTGDRLLVGTAAGGVRVDGPGGPPLVLPAAHADEVRAAALGPGGWFATGSADREVRVWDAAGRVVVALPQTRPVRRLFWSADGANLTVLAEGERALRRWHLPSLWAEFAAAGLGGGPPD